MRCCASPWTTQALPGTWRLIIGHSLTLTGSIAACSASIMLSLATLEIVRLPSRLVESTIAASVILAALNNIRPVLTERGWLLAFCFGLVHGFGFANALLDLGLGRQTLALALVGFNLGV